MPVKYPKTLADRATLYGNALHELRMRLRTIERVQQTKLPQLFVFETCQLQLRLCAECLAVACLAAQGDFKTHKAFRDRYEVPEIFRALSKSYPNFFPRPTQIEEVEGGWHFDMDVVRLEAINRSGVERVWKLAGSHLHRTSAKRYVARTNRIDFDAVKKATEGFWWLIASHSIELRPERPKAALTILQVLVDRQDDAMLLRFMHVNAEESTIEVEDFPAWVPPS